MPKTLCVTSILCAAAGCGGNDAEISSKSAALTAECVAADADLPAGAWECSSDQTIECNDGSGTANIDTVFVRDTQTDGCSAESDVTVSDPGPFAPGVHEIQVIGGSDAILCETTLTVVDTKAPTLEAHTLNIWPPNHKFHTISVNDCVTVTDSCQDDLQAEFIWASSDEPVDDRGDGHHSPDILLDGCDSVQVRAERQGPKDGRVYKLGVRVVDGAGNATESECAIIVDHDQRGVEGADSGESYRLTLDGQNGAPTCDGVNEPPTPSDDPPTPSDPPSEDPPADDQDAGVEEPPAAVQ